MHQNIPKLKSFFCSVFYSFHNNFVFECALFAMQISFEVWNDFVVEFI